ncbi:hypothetical protein Tco_1569634 [Tanacetum coccineum]
MSMVNCLGLAVVQCIAIVVNILEFEYVLALTDSVAYRAHDSSEQLEQALSLVGVVEDADNANKRQCNI